MTMGFTLPAAGMPKDIAVGDTVEFEFRQGKDGTFDIVSITRTGAAQQPAGDAK
jgi:Cu(I)/Ag(I) efflux system membrane fusion protein